MSKLTSQQCKQYKDKVFIAPLDALTEDEAEEVKSEIEFIEKKWPNELEGLGRNYVHLISPIFDKVVHNSNILDAVESIIGKNILACGTTLFIKNAIVLTFIFFPGHVTSCFCIINRICRFNLSIYFWFQYNRFKKFWFF